MRIRNNHNIDGVMGLLVHDHETTCFTNGVGGTVTRIGGGWETYSQPDTMPDCLLRYLDNSSGLHKNDIAMVVDVRDFLIRQHLDRLLDAAAILGITDTAIRFEYLIASLFLWINENELLDRTSRNDDIEFANWLVVVRQVA